MLTSTLVLVFCAVLGALARPSETIIDDIRLFENSSEHTKEMIVHEESGKTLVRKKRFLRGDWLFQYFRQRGDFYFCGIDRDTGNEIYTNGHWTVSYGDHNDRYCRVR